MRSKYMAVVAIVLLSFLLTLYLYPQLPEKMATHWDAHGRVNGYSSKFWGAFLLPFTLVFLTLLLLFIPRIDPLRHNIEEFRDYYEGFLVVLFLFLLSIHIQVLLWNLGIKINPLYPMSIGGGFLFYYIGIMLEKAKRNWFIGIRTPWTLSSDEVWDKTHKLGAYVFKLAGVLAFLGVLVPSLAIYLILVPVLGGSLYLILFSYLDYKKEEEKSRV